MDFRLPEYRREVFLRFYEFHLRHRSHPGCVYYLMPWLRQRYGWDEEQALWFAFLNGNTQNPVTSLMLMNHGPTPKHAPAMLDWFRQNYGALAFDTDRRYHKKVFAKSVECYRSVLRGRTQGKMFAAVAAQGWQASWQFVSSLYSFGRLSAFSYAEYLRIMGVEWDCDTLMLDDLDGSRSHRNGLCWVVGREDLDWHKSNPKFAGVYSDTILRYLKNAGAGLLQEMKRRAHSWPYLQQRDVSYFTLESTLCTYKGWHRVNRRYPNVYNDMLHDRIKAAETAWPKVDFNDFWLARKECLPQGLRMEHIPGDPGCVPIKQNHYRLTGQVIMMDLDWPCFANDFRQGWR